MVMLPEGEAAPEDGALPEGADQSRPLRAYVHVPFCRARCGYCDFNTYTPGELAGTFGFPGYERALLRELGLAGRVLTSTPLESVFFGGGTPSYLPPDSVRRILLRLADVFGLAEGAEVTLEANPEDVTPAAVQGWLEAGVTRLSVGMQSADPTALAVLDRRHSPGSPQTAVRLASEGGLQHVSLDLIYGIPGQSDQSWRRTVQEALEAGPDHVSAYALGVESGTRLGRQVDSGEVPAPDPDRAAEQYEIADAELAAAGLAWYEISNWSLPGAECRHNLGYWQADNWWGFGPGAHSHVGGVRWWNRKHPARWAALLDSGRSPALGREVLSAEQERVEQVMLGIRLRTGLPAGDFAPSTLATLVEHGLCDVAGGRLVLTIRGRMLADTVTRTLLGWQAPAGKTGEAG